MHWFLMRKIGCQTRGHVSDMLADRLKGKLCGWSLTVSVKGALILGHFEWSKISDYLLNVVSLDG